LIWIYYLSPYSQSLPLAGGWSHITLARHVVRCATPSRKSSGMRSKMRCCLSFVASLLKRMVADAATASFYYVACVLGRGESTHSKPFPQGKGVNAIVTPAAGSIRLPSAVMPLAAVGFAFGLILLT
jgi:hypothetical protein